MLKDYDEFFAKFKTIHDKYQEDPGTWKDEFNQTGLKALRIIRRYENALCSRTENTGFGKFSENLSDKFWEEVRLNFPLIDEVKLN